MTCIYALKPLNGGVDFAPVWQASPGTLAAGCTALTTVRVAGQTLLYAYNKVTRATQVSTLQGAAPWLTPGTVQADLTAHAWDQLCSFVLGNQPYLLAYEKAGGNFGFYAVKPDGSLSRPAGMVFVRNTPTQGFTTVAAYTSLGQVFITGYDFDTGVVANFSVGVVATSPEDTPPLQGLNVWYHQWAKAWTHFAFFQLGGANFFFKINTGKLNVNIDHMQDNPAMGSVEVGSYLQDQLPDALKISATATLPWADGEPMLLSYIAASGKTVAWRIHADCQGWTEQGSVAAETGATALLSWRLDDTSYALVYTGA